MSNKSRAESEEETRRISVTSESEEEEEEELDEFGRVKRRREKFVTERSMEEPERSDSETEERKRHSRRHHDSRRRSSSASPRRYSRRYSDSDGEYSNSRHHRSSRSSYHHHHHSNNNSHRYHHRHRGRGDLYSEAAQYIDTEFYPTKVYIGDLVDVSKEQVESIFSRFGSLQEVKLVEGKDYGFITFGQKEAALAAIKNMHGALLGSKHIKVNRAKIPERNKVGFGNVPWTDEDGLMAKESLYSHPPSGSLMNDPLNPPDMNGLPPRRALTSYDDL
ncbi:hypothetical protein K501DRAFT_329373 [Backusella circina FSU 941]|nr:hypothetical protein K501DRAFT_329373 [Backusella circina FSU 941]